MQSGTQAIGEFPYRREEWVGNTTWVHQGSSKMVPYVQLSNYNLVHSVIRQDIPSQTVVYCTPLHKTPTTLVMHHSGHSHIVQHWLFKAIIMHKAYIHCLTCHGPSKITMLWTLCEFPEIALELSTSGTPFAWAVNLQLLSVPLIRAQVNTSRTTLCYMVQFGPILGGFQVQSLKCIYCCYNSLKMHYNMTKFNGTH